MVIVLRYSMILDSMTKSKSVIITGKICSGKTTVTRAVLELIPRAKRISFGQFLKEYCDENGIEYSANREALQDLGQRFIDEDPEQLLAQVILSASPVQGDALLFEGVRHESIFTAVQHQSSEVKSIYVDADPQLRYERLIKRSRDIDGEMSFSDFRTMDNHPAEKEIEGLRSRCELVLTSTQEPMDINALKAYLAE